MRGAAPSRSAVSTRNVVGAPWLPLGFAKFARFVNEFPRDRSVEFEQKLTTRALDELVRGNLNYKLVRRRQEA